MKQRAPVLSALITILRSVGPVISTRRSSRSGGAGATRQSASRIDRVAPRKSGRSPSSSRSCRSAARSASSSRRPLELAMQARRRTRAPRRSGSRRTGVRRDRGPRRRRGGSHLPPTHSRAARHARALWLRGPRPRRRRRTRPRTAGTAAGSRPSPAHRGRRGLRPVGATLERGTPRRPGAGAATRRRPRSGSPGARDAGPIPGRSRDESECRTWSACTRHAAWTSSVRSLAGTTLLDPSLIHTPVPASATCSACLAKSLAG